MGCLPPAHNNKPLWDGSENCSFGEVATENFSSDKFFLVNCKMEHRALDNRCM